MNLVATLLLLQSNTLLENAHGHGHSGGGHGHHNGTRNNVSDGHVPRRPGGPGGAPPPTAAASKYGARLVASAILVSQIEVVVVSVTDGFFENCVQYRLILDNSTTGANYTEAREFCEVSADAVFVGWFALACVVNIAVRVCCDREAPPYPRGAYNEMV